MQQTLHFDTLHTSLTPLEWDCRALHIIITLFEQGFSVHLHHPTEQGTTVLIKELSSPEEQQMMETIQNLIEKINLEYELQYPSYEEGYLQHIYRIPFWLTKHMNTKHNQLKDTVSKEKQLV
ncbi:hypothetical protein BK704_11400 [[Bacillus thuringiensis] serovar konkukian]|nr:hypothetical protein [Bacillus thuringiensis]MED1305172.1 hypothetical protein [Bacillus pacificus]OUB11890.1 hypothetical protein BK704_11400 [[Bacillus thuringiensis] serovar konkukian]